MWNPLASWESRSRAWRTTVILFLVDLGLLLFALLNFPILAWLWEHALVGVLPDFYDIVVRQLIAALSGASPSTVVASGTLLSFVTAFFSLLTIHLPISYGIGWLFDKLSKDRIWSLVCYAVAIVVLLVLHVALYSFLNA